MKRFLLKMENGKYMFSLACIAVFMFIGMSCFAQVKIINPAVKPAATTETDVSKDLLLLGNTWLITECCGWSGTWTRRPNTATFDCKWKHTNGSTAADVVQITSWDRVSNVVTITRKSMNGYYNAVYNASNKTLTNGTATWYPAGQSWSAVIM